MTNWVFFQYIVAVALIPTVAGCDSRAQLEQFKLVASPSGELFRLNGATGAVHKVHETMLVRVSETDRVRLQVGYVYVFENGSSMKYLGQGKFEPKAKVLTLEEYLKGQAGKK